jgi:RNA polymerase-binding transcription factor
MDPEALPQYREILLAQQRQIEQRVLRLETELHGMEAERDIEYTDHAQEEAVNDEMIALDEHGRRQVADIRAALARIDDGTYGSCARCGEPIDPRRLEKLPTARYCIDCQERLEAAAQSPPGARVPDTKRV